MRKLTPHPGKWAAYENEFGHIYFRRQHKNGSICWLNSSVFESASEEEKLEETRNKTQGEET